MQTKQPRIKTQRSWGVYLASGLLTDANDDGEPDECCPGDFDGSGDYLCCAGLTEGSYFVKASRAGCLTEVYDGLACAPSPCEVTDGHGVGVVVGEITPDIDFDLGHGIRIVLLDRHRQQLTGIVEARGQLVQDDNDLFELGALLPQRLGTLGLVPHVGFFEFALNFGQALRLAIVVKDTSSTHRSVRRGQGWSV